MADDATATMRPCGCHRGRPCTCEMGTRALPLAFACGECINCQLNARAVQKRRKPVRKCVQYDAFVAEQALDRLEIAPGCVLRMCKPDWDVREKSAFYTHMRQLRLGLLALRVHSAVTIERQMALRKKYNRDLEKTRAALERVDAQRHTPTATRRMTADVTHVDSDVFDSHSKQLIPAETLLPDLLARLEVANETIATEERNLKLVEAHVSDVAVRKLQETVRDYQRAQRWKRIWWRFRQDVEWAAAVEIQSMVRMVNCKPLLPFLRELKREKTRLEAAQRICRFFRRLYVSKREQDRRRQQEAILQARAQKTRAAEQLLNAAAKIICRMTLWKWRERNREATAHDERKVLSAVVRIQRNWRGLRERLNYHRIRYRRLLSDPVRTLYDRFVCHGDLWQLLFEVDAAFRRYEHRQQEEQQDAKAFVAELVRDKREYEDKMMQAWFTASAMESPIVRGTESVVSAFSLGTEVPEGFPLAQAILQSPMAKDLVHLSPSKIKSDVFPDDLPPDVIRQATYEGYGVSEIVAVMRGMVAQGKRIDDCKVVLSALQSRAPLMIRPWKPERVVRNDLQPPILSVKAPNKHTSSTAPAPKKKLPPTPATQSLFLTDNMIDNVPGGLMGGVDRLMLVAGLKCFDPDAAQCKGRGAFVFRLESSLDPWRSYTEAFPLMKIRREQLVQDAVKQHTAKLRENRCFTAFDILHNVHGIDEFVSWGIPRPLVMAIYDVIELLHQQSVNRSDRSIKRQVRVSAQFEAFFERQKRRSERNDEDITLPALRVAAASASTTSNLADTSALDEVAIALERDVLDLPLQSDVLASEVLFKAHFLLCDSSQQPSKNTNQHLQVELSPSNYKRFLSEVVAAQLAGDADCVKQLVQNRMETASRLAWGCELQLATTKLVTARDLKQTLCHGNEIIFHEALRHALQQLLSCIPDGGERSMVRKAGHKSEKRNNESRATGRRLAPLSPLIRQSKVAIDKLDDALRGINIPS